MNFKAFRIRNAILLLIIAAASSFAAPSNAGLSQPGASVTLRLLALDQTRRFQLGRLNLDYTPLSGYAHLAGLEKLPKVTLRASLQKQNAGNTAQDVVMVENPSSHLAFFIHLTLLKGSADVHPVFWQDNDFELMPGEKREISATYSQSKLGGAGPAIRVTGWNVRPQMVH